MVLTYFSCLTDLKIDKIDKTRPPGRPNINLSNFSALSYSKYANFVTWLVKIE